MPTTTQEADKIIDLCSKYGVEPKNLLGLAKDLHDQVGQSSDNWSVRETMRMLYDRAIDLSLKFRPADMSEDDFLSHLGVVRPGPAESPPKAPWSVDVSTSGWFALWLCIVIGHMGVWVTLLLSCIMTLIHQPWYIAVLAISFSGYLLATDTVCPVTRWENVVRRKMGWKEVGHFTHWYVICPIFHGRGCKRSCPIHRVGPG